LAFACEEDVLLQYAAVNKYGRSSYSRGVRVDVRGGQSAIVIWLCCNASS